MKEYLAYVGIDFGTSGSSFSYWFPKSNDDKESIKVKKWEGTGTANKIETEILLDEDFNQVLALGRNQCDQFMKKTKEKFLYFSNVKMYLYKNEFEISENYSKKKFKLVEVISKFLEKLRDEAIQELKAKQIAFQKFSTIEQSLDAIKWIITVPAIWSEKHKTCMIEAAKLAKLIKDEEDPSNFFALEPEAAACYYAMSDIADKDILEHPYIICDIGGGTTDITTHERKMDDKEGKHKIIELYHPMGGADGSREINKYILEEILVKKLFTQKAYDKIKEKIKKEGEESDDLKEDFRRIDDDINKFKQTFELKNIKEFYKIKFEAFKDGFEEEPKIEELVDNYNKNIKQDWQIKIRSKKGWILDLPYKIVHDLLKELIVDKASKYIKEIVHNLQNRHLNKKEVKSVILAGGASCNLSIIELFRASLPNLNIVSCDDPEIAVVKGAIYFAKNPLFISQRIAKFSIGVQVIEEWKKKLDDIPEAIKMYDEKNNYFICLNYFSPFYKKNYPIEVSEKGKKKGFDMYSEECHIQFYKSNFDGPVYVVGQKDKEGNLLTEKFAELKFKVENFDEKETGVDVTVKLGGTFISAKIEYLKTKNIFYQSFKFD
jgi:molecular chaperone DnaK (HSP70)